MRHRLEVVGLVSVMWLVAFGCSSSNDGDGVLEAEAVPTTPSTEFDLAESCARIAKRHEIVRDVDVRTGLIRWACGDVPGVTDPDLGQEYCEYHPVQSGRVVNRASDLRPDAALDCVFTTVFTGSRLASKLRSAMAAPENLGTTPQSDAIVEMQRSFNTRSAATQLISDCQWDGASTSAFQGYLRMAACYEAYARGGDNAAELRRQCRGAVSISDTKWTQLQGLGARIEAPSAEGYERQRDVAGCLAVRGRSSSPWRNSDAMICSRAARAAADCSCDFNAVPSSVVGIPMTGWSNDALPSGCRLARVDGEDYPLVVICRATAEDVADIPLHAEHARSVQTFCHDRFGVDIVLKLPFRSLTSEGSCARDPGFCAEYMNGETPPIADAGSEH